MSNESFSPQESLKLITNMIDKTKHNISVRSHYFLVWGWGGFIAFIAQFILVRQNYQKHWQVWYITFLCAIIMIYWIRRDSKKQQTVTYVGESISYLWTGIGIGFFVLSMIFMKIGYQFCYPFFILFYGLGTFITGRLLKFSPLVIGGIINFIIAMGAAWLPYDYQMLCGAAAILTSYIIPGHLLRSKYQN